MRERSVAFDNPQLEFIAREAERRNVAQAAVIRAAVEAEMRRQSAQRRAEHDYSNRERANGR